MQIIQKWKTDKKRQEAKIGTKEVYGLLRHVVCWLHIYKERNKGIMDADKTENI